MERGEAKSRVDEIGQLALGLIRSEHWPAAVYTLMTLFKRLMSRI